MNYPRRGAWFGPRNDAVLLFSRCMGFFRCCHGNRQLPGHWWVCYLDANTLQWAYNEAQGTLEVKSSTISDLVCSHQSLFFLFAASSWNLDKSNWFPHEGEAGVRFWGKEPLKQTFREMFFCLAVACLHRFLVTWKTDERMNSIIQWSGKKKSTDQPLSYCISAIYFPKKAAEKWHSLLLPVGPRTGSLHFPNRAPVFKSNVEAT